jgi:VanZ family protein
MIWWSSCSAFPVSEESLLANPMTQKEQVSATSGRPRIISRIQEKIAQVNWEVMSSKFLGVVCGLVLGGLLVAGLWPFHAPRNQVTWSAGGHGLRFGRHGTILSSGQFQTANAPADAPCSLEIWFEPGLTAASGTLIAFYAPGNPRQFSLHQSIADLALRSDIRDGRYRTRTTRLYVEDIFRRGKPLFVTVTSNGGQTSVYIDGVLARTAPVFPLSSRDFAGELIIANSPVVDNSWSGSLRGLAFYDRELTPAQVLHHNETWTKNGQPDGLENKGAIALYLFDEGAGRIIHNHAPRGADLYIPQRYLVVDEIFLRSFWDAFSPTRSYFQDVLVNIAGFIPFGFLFCAYLSLTRRIKRVAAVTIILGFSVSLTIESLQAFLPTRDSDTTDVITNTLGTCLGVWLYGCNVCRVLFAKIWTHLLGTTAKDSTRSHMN